MEVGSNSSNPDFAFVTFSMLSAGSDFTCGTSVDTGYGNIENWCCEGQAACKLLVAEQQQAAWGCHEVQGCRACANRWDMQGGWRRELGGIQHCTPPDNACLLVRPGVSASPRLAPLAVTGGAGTDGQLGNNGDSDSTDPVKVAGSQSFVSVSAGGEHACALDDSALAWCW